jgi:predicted membrane protein DUF2142
MPTDSASWAQRRRVGEHRRSLGVRPNLPVPSAAAWCATIAVGMGLIWSLIVPPLQAHDEPAHIYYAQFLAETGQTPRPKATGSYSPEEQAVINGVRLFDVAGNLEARPPWTEAQDEQLRRTLERGLPPVGQGGDAGVGSYPPLFYAAGSLVYLATPGTLLDRVWSMRLVSVALAGVVSILLFLYAREIFPCSPWVWPMLALVGTAVPIFSFMSGVFNPDLALTAASCGVFLLLARCFRDELTATRAVLIAVVAAAGVLVKLPMLGLVPGIALGVLAIALKQRRPSRALLAGAVFGSLIALYAVVNVVIWNRPVLVGSGGGVATEGVAAGNWREMLVYVWQDYLPRLPFMVDLFSDYPAWNRWFLDWIGRFGWGDYGVPSSAGVVAALILGIVVMTGLVHFIRHARVVAHRFGAELLTYAAMAVGLLFLLGYTGYGYSRTTGYGFEQARYLLPLLPLYIGSIGTGLVSMRAGAGAVFGTVIVVGSTILCYWGMALTISRFYG